MHRIVAIGFILTMTLMAQDPKWERMKSLRPGEVLWITYLDGTEERQEQAKMMAWTEDSLAVRVQKKEVVLSRNDVRQVKVYAGKSHPRGALWGTVIGAIPGVTIGTLCARGSGGEYAAACLGAYTGAGAAIGGVIGAAVGMTRKTEVYRASVKPDTTAGALPH